MLDIKINLPNNHYSKIGDNNKDNSNMPSLFTPKSQQTKCIKLTYWRFVNDYRVTSLSTKYQTTKGKIPKII